MSEEELPPLLPPIAVQSVQYPAMHATSWVPNDTAAPVSQSALPPAPAIELAKVEHSVQPIVEEQEVEPPRPLKARLAKNSQLLWSGAKEKLRSLRYIPETAEEAQAAEEARAGMWGETVHMEHARDRVPLMKAAQQEEQEHEDTLPPYNPDFHAPILLKMINSKELLISLQRAGANATTLVEQSVGIRDFKQNNYSLRDLHTLLPVFADLLAIGFNKSSITGNWYMDQVCTLYDMKPAEVCQTLNFRAPDFVASGLDVDAIAAMGLTVGLLIDLGLDFETTYTMTANVSFAKFAQTLQLKTNDLDKLNLNEAQKLALSKHRGWRMDRVAKHCGIDAGDIGEHWFGLEYNFN